MKKIIFLLPLLFLLSCASTTYIKTLPSEQLIQGVESKFLKQDEITKPNIPDSSDTAEKLRRLNKLNDAGLFTKKEYEERRKAIVGDM